jgi:hypothetical protein
MVGLFLIFSCNPRATPRSLLVPLDNALAAGRHQVAAELRGFIVRPEQADHGAVVNALAAKIGAQNHRAARSQQHWKFVLQCPEGCPSINFATF